MFLIKIKEILYWKLQRDIICFSTITRNLSRFISTRYGFWKAIRKSVFCARDNPRQLSTGFTVNYATVNKWVDIFATHIRRSYLALYDTFANALVIDHISNIRRINDAL